MSYPAKKNLSIQKGSTFSKVIRWEAPPVVFKAITSINKSAPIQLVVPAHGLVDGWRIAITDVVGMKEVNAKAAPPADEDFYKAAKIDANTLQLPGISSASYSIYVSGGYIRYNSPVNLGGYTARMQIREKVKSTVAILDLTTENGGIVLDNNEKTITMYLAASDTEGVVKNSAVYDLEMVSSTGVVIPLLFGAFTFTDEVTRDD